uniref:Uracil-DNA glycosylase n=1 Tax=Lygus hesperus TaxID=30085 RepID=A0A0A9XH62_LYGHE
MVRCNRIDFEHRYIIFKSVLDKTQRCSQHCSCNCLGVCKIFTTLNIDGNTEKVTNKVTLLYNMVDNLKHAIYHTSHPTVCSIQRGCVCSINMQHPMVNPHT